MTYRRGFTLVELIIVMTIFAIVAGLITTNLIRPQTSASVDATVNILASDLKAQQIKSMIGDTNTMPTAQSFGIYFENNKYTLFTGSSYNPLDTNNFTVNLDANITLTNFPLPPSNPIIFSRRSGEVLNFISGQNTLTIQNIETGDQKILTLNHPGSLSVN